MKQITHKDVLKSFNNIIEYFKDDDFEGKTTLDEIIVMEFIRQQENKDKLLELRKELGHYAHYTFITNETKEYVLNLKQQIQALEEELK